MDPLRDLPAHLHPGMRVVVRHLLPGGSATDALGMLVARDEDSCTVDTRRGAVRIELAQIVAAKRVPPPPAPRR